MDNDNWYVQKLCKIGLWSFQHWIFQTEFRGTSMYLRCRQKKILTYWHLEYRNFKYSTWVFFQTGNPTTIVTLNINLIRNDLRKSYTHLSTVHCKFLLAKRSVFCWIYIYIHIYCLSWLIMIRLFTCVIKNTHGFLLFTTEVQGWIFHGAFNLD